MGYIQACLLDAYSTVIREDGYRDRWNTLADLAGVPRDQWRRARSMTGPALQVGHLSGAQAHELVLLACGVRPEPGLVAKLIRKDRELLHASARLYDDVVPLLTGLRERGIATAIVSNCADNTRGLLVSLGLADLTDALVLSCEAGCGKPAAAIYQAALDRLGVTAEHALFVDDQPVFCAGAQRLGITAVRIARGEDDEDDADDWAAVTIGSLADVMGML